MFDHLFDRPFRHLQREKRLSNTEVGKLCFRTIVNNDNAQIFSKKVLPVKANQHHDVGLSENRVYSQL